MNILILLIGIFSSTVIMTGSEENNIEFDKKFASKYAIIALKEYYSNSQQIKSNFRSDYKTMNPIITYRKLKDCQGIERDVVLVTFERIKRKGSASVYMKYQDGFLVSILNRSFSSVNPNSTIEQFKQLKQYKNYDIAEFLFGCGV